jgi:S-methylmethionine-dependent homocysteine/selenocysteine methylase
MTTLIERLETGDVVLIDGGMGTELERRGVEMDNQAWAGTAMLTRPDVIKDIHLDFIDAGADIIIANTYAAAPHVLEHAGLRAEAGKINRMGCRLARQAVDEAASVREIYVAGSMSSFRAGLDVDKLPDERAARASYHEQAMTLADGGVDLIIAEMMLDPFLTEHCVAAAVETGLPVWVGFSARLGDDGGVLGFSKLFNHPLEEVIAVALAHKPEACGIMHSDVGVTVPALEELKKHWSGPLFAYPHSGEFKMPNWQFDTVISPAAYAKEAMRYIDMGVRAIGGCCGMGPDHIRALKDTLPSFVA